MKVTDTTLHDLVLKRLETEIKPEDEWSAPVMAALEGPDELARLFADGREDAPSVPPGESRGPAWAQEPHTQDAAPAQRLATAFLRAVTAEGFQGIGPKSHPRPRSREDVMLRRGAVLLAVHMPLSAATVASLRGHERLRFHGRRQE